MLLRATNRLRLQFNKYKVDSNHCGIIALCINEQENIILEKLLLENNNKVLN